MNDCVPLLEALEGRFEQQLEELPPVLRERVVQDFPISWDKVSEDVRRVLAVEVDTLNVRTKEQERQAWEAFCRAKLSLENVITRWESVETPTAIDRQIKENRLAELRQELAPLENQLARGDYIEPEDEKSHTRAPSHLDHDPELQARANQIAQQRKATTGRSITKGQVANILAKELGIDASTVERRIRKQWK